MITKRLSQVLTILEDGQIQLREDTIFEEDGIELFRQHHRRVLEPGQDVSAESKRIKDVSSVIWTQEVIDARKRFLEENNR